MFQSKIFTSGPAPDLLKMLTPSGIDVSTPTPVHFLVQIHSTKQRCAGAGVQESTPAQR